MDQPNQIAFKGNEEAAEQTRLDILSELAILDTPPESEFDTLVELASHVTGCKIALLSLLDSERQWFKAKVGLEARETPRNLAFCAHAIREPGTTIVSDARLDERFSTNPLVTGDPHIVFYAGVPLRMRAKSLAAPSVAAIGTLCVIDDQPRLLDTGQQAALENLARLAEVMIERRASVLEAQVLANDRKTNLRQMNLRNRQFRQAERMANIGSWRLNLADNRTEWSEQVYTIHGLPVGEDPRLENALDFYPGEARVIVTSALADAIETGKPFAVETDFITARGEPRRVRSMGEIEIQDGRPVAVIGVFQDVTEQHALESRLRRSAQKDDLTGLPNRAHFNEFLTCKIEKAARHDEKLSVLIIDLDGFKAVNDRCGHRAGDTVLQDFARKLQAPHLRDCFVARLGGDEFVAVIDDREACRNLTPLLVRLLTDLRATIEHRDGPVTVSATIGASHWSRETLNGSELLHRADMALYDAKQFSRGSAKLDGADDFIMADRLLN